MIGPGDRLGPPAARARPQNRAAGGNFKFKLDWNSSDSDSECGSVRHGGPHCSHGHTVADMASWVTVALTESPIRHTSPPPGPAAVSRRVSVAERSARSVGRDPEPGLEPQSRRHMIALSAPSYIALTGP